MLKGKHHLCAAVGYNSPGLPARAGATRPEVSLRGRWAPVPAAPNKGRSPSASWKLFLPSLGGEFETGNKNEYV